MYLAVVVLLMGVLPIGSILIELVVLHSSADPVLLIGKWFAFWSVGIRLLLAGVRQVANPAFTADSIFGLKDRGVLPIVRELGFGNVAIGSLGVFALINRGWIAPAALAGGLFYGLAGLAHLLKGDRNATETIALVSDVLIFIVLAGYLTIASLTSGG